MNAQQRSAIALNLIANDLINTKLVMGLRALGIDAGVYGLCLAESIFILMGYGKTQQTAELYDRYAALSRKVLDVPLSDADHNALEALALEIYETLLREFPGV